jgi:hypothetical protein
LLLGYRLKMRDEHGWKDSKPYSCPRTGLTLHEIAETNILALLQQMR